MHYFIQNYVALLFQQNILLSDEMTETDTDTDINIITTLELFSLPLLLTNFRIQKYLQHIATNGQQRFYYGIKNTEFLQILSYDFKK